MTITIVPATLADWPEIRAIYEEGILTNMATFNAVADIPDGQTWFGGKLDGFVIKAVSAENELLGWGCLSPTSSRRVYRGVVEDSVYVASHASGQGIGSALLDALITRAEAAQFWTIIASIFPENAASIHIHEKAGFRIVGIREKIAQLNGEWRDVAWMERRSRSII